MVWCGGTPGRVPASRVPNRSRSCFLSPNLLARRDPRLLPRTMGGPKGRRRLEQGFLGAEHFLTPEGKLKVRGVLFCCGCRPS